MEGRNETDWTPTATMRLIALVGGFVIFFVGIWLLVSGIKADGAVDIKSAVLSGTLRTGSAGLYVCFFALFIIVISIASLHFERKSAANENPRSQRMFGMFLILLFSFFAAGFFHVITNDVVFSAASGTLGVMLLWAVLSIFRD